MIVQTRYRDIPWEDVIRHYTPAFRGRLPRSYWESSIRGRPITVETPASGRRAQGYICNGPFYLLNPNPDGYTVVCPHVAEIGD